MAADAASYARGARGGCRGQGDARGSRRAGSPRPPARPPRGPGSAPARPLRGPGSAPTRSSSHLRVRCLYKRCLGINVYTRRPFLFPGGSFLGWRWGVPPSHTHPVTQGKKPRAKRGPRGPGRLLHAPAVGGPCGQAGQRRGGAGLGAARPLLRGRQRGPGEPPGRRRDEVPGMPRGVGDASPPQPRGCCPPTRPWGDARRGTPPKGTGISRVVCQRISLRRSSSRGGGVRGKAQDGAERGGGRCGGAKRRE